MAVTVTAPEAEAAHPRAAGALTVLIGFADALAAPETAWSLRDAGAHVTAFARRGSRPALRHVRGVSIVEITAPEDDAEAALSELAAAVAGRDALMPLDDASVWLCDALARRGSDVPVVGPTGARAELALDKRLQVAAARSAGFAVPATEVIERDAQLRALTMLPVALKPAFAARSEHGRLVRGRAFMCGTAADRDAARSAWDEAEPLLAQPLIAGVGEGLFGIAGPDGVRALSAHRRVRMMNPQGSGSSACVAIPVDPELAAGARRMLTDVGWSGLFMLEFLRDAAGTAWFMELNGRTWGSMALARRQGLEYPAWALAQSAGRPDGADRVLTAAGPGTQGPPIVCRHLGRELVHLMMVLRGPRSGASAGWPTRRRALADVLRVRRGERWYNWRTGETRVFVADTVDTVAAAVRRAR